ncbi:MAG: Lrp/AsnC family transcriptional regulator [Anaerolineales bacterium]|nr:Lrp/AsnC family transcriptional regulator [Anaerolineales bacterium]MDW8160971.1 Lrp/AsnC family transcriptional regulator [Anaerolineales bacterium]
MSKVDIIDKKIVDLLIEDGRLSCSEIARRLGISERSVRYRLEKLFEREIIRVRAIVNPKSLGFGVVADVMVEVEADCIQEVARKMTEYSCISYVAYAIGETDVSVQIIARSNEEVYQFVTEVIGKTPGVRKTVTSIVPAVLKDVYQWSIPLEVCEPRE